MIIFDRKVIIRIEETRRLCFSILFKETEKYLRMTALNEQPLWICLSVWEPLGATSKMRPSKKYIFPFWSNTTYTNTSVQFTFLWCFHLVRDEMLFFSAFDYTKLFVETDQCFSNSPWKQRERSELLCSCRVENLSTWWRGARIGKMAELIPARSRVWVSPLR